MVITQAEFVISNTDVSKCPPPVLPEYAFIGRSNVGKSSLINMLTNNKNLAKTSSTPGKTQLINHFLINKEWYLVDLPGYGYAQVSKVKRHGFTKINRSYIESRENLVNLFVLVDSRHAPLAVDMEFMSYLGEQGIPFSIIFTKADKLSKRQLKTNIEIYKEKLLKQWEEVPPYFISSSSSYQGKEEILEYINQTNKMINNQ